MEIALQHLMSFALKKLIRRIRSINRLGLSLILMVGATLIFYIAFAVLIGLNIFPPYYKDILIVIGPILGFFSASFSYMFQNARSITLLREQIYAELSRIYTDLDMVLEIELGEEEDEKKKEIAKNSHVEAVDWMLTYI